MNQVATGGNVFLLPKRKVAYRLVLLLYRSWKFLKAGKKQPFRLLRYGIRILKSVRNGDLAREASTAIRLIRVCSWSIHRPALRRRLLENASTRIEEWLENFWK